MKKNQYLKGAHPIIFVPNIFPNSHLIQKCIWNPQLFWNSYWLCIHFWIKWELGNIFDTKMIKWTHIKYQFIICQFKLLSLSTNFLTETFLIQSNLVIRNVLIRNRLVLRNHFLWPIVNLLHKDKEHWRSGTILGWPKISLSPSLTVLNIIINCLEDTNYLKMQKPSSHNFFPNMH